jgi:hypothetical protein
MRTQLRAACAVFILLIAPGVSAQSAVSTVSLGDPDPPGWDASGHMSWLTVNKTGIAPEWDRWYDVATVGGSIGRYIGRHLKVEFDAATSASAEVYVERQVLLPQQTYPTYISQPQRFRMSTFAGGAVYQFFDNRWLHPFAGGGLESALETREVSQVVYPVTLPAAAIMDPPGTTSTWHQRPFTTVGFKWFVGERAFVRSDVRTTFDRGGLAQVSWRTGFGVDF